VRELLETLVAQEQPARDQQRRDHPGRDDAQDERRRHQDQLVDQRALEYRPDHRQLALRTHAGDLLGVHGEVIAEHARGLPRRDLGQDGHVIEHGGNVIEQGKQASGHRRS